MPAASEFPGTGEAGNGLGERMTTQAAFVDQMKQGCQLCHQMGNQLTREISHIRDRFDSTAHAWDNRIRFGQRGVRMVGIIGGKGRDRTVYFLVLGSAVINDSEFSKFWEMLPHYSFKHSVIRRAEIGLTQKLARAGFRFAALCNYEVLHARMPNRAPRSKSGKFDRPVNSMHYLWEPLIAEFGCPFLKVQMLRDNPKRIPNMDHWDTVVRQHTEYDCGLIERHLARLKTGR